MEIKRLMRGMLFREFGMLLGKEVYTFGADEEEGWYLLDYSALLTE
jgi:hypothetical protein